MTDYSFARAWHDVATIAPDRVAIACRDVHETFGEFDRRADQLARRFATAGVGAGDKVAIECVNGREYLETFFAALKLGARCNGVSVSSVQMPCRSGSPQAVFRTGA